LIFLDENFPEGQRQLLRAWRIHIRQVGYEVGRKGMKDHELIPFLLRFRRPTFFTLDRDLLKREFCHSRLCLVYLDVWQYEAALFLRRLLRHRKFDTDAKRLGTVIRVTHTGLWVSRLQKKEEGRFGWNE
jgi:hypothetical protein